MKPPQDFKTLPIQETEYEARHLSTGEGTMMEGICRLNAGEGGQGLHQERRGGEVERRRDEVSHPNILLLRENILLITFEHKKTLVHIIDANTAWPAWLN
jgi:hypothetical protein